MTRILTILVAVVLVGTAGWYFLQQNGTAKITVQAELTAGGQDVTALVEWSVATVADVDTSGDLTFRTLEAMTPDPGDPFTYTVPSGVPVAVSANLPDLEMLETVVTLDAGQIRTETFSLNAGLVNLTLLGVDRDTMLLSIDTPTGGSGQSLPANDVSTLAFAPGSYRISVGNDAVQAGEDLTIEAGQTYEVTLDLRQGDLTIAFGSWISDMPDGAVSLMSESGDFLQEVVISPQGTAVFAGLAFGTYGFSLDHRNVLELDPRPNAVLDAPQKTIDFGWSPQRILVSFSGVDPATVRSAELQVVESQDRGIPYTTVPIVGPTGVTPVYYRPLTTDPTDLTFALVLRDGGRVLGMVDLGNSVEQQREVSISVGDGFALCGALFFPSDCVPPP